MRCSSQREQAMQVKIKEQEAVYDTKESNEQKTYMPFVDKKQGWKLEISTALLDYMLQNLSKNEFILLIYFIRKIDGWGKDSDKIPYTQILKETPISSRNSIGKAIVGLVEKSIIKQGWDSRNESTRYTINRQLKIKINRNKGYEIVD